MSKLTRLIVVAPLVAALAGCEISSDLAARSEPPSAEGKPYPNLASVPPNPRRVQPAATEAQLRTLEAERAAANEADAKLRAAGIPDQPPPPVQLPAVGPRGASSIAPPPSAPAPAAGSTGSVLSLEFPTGGSRLSVAQRQQIRGHAGDWNQPGSRVRVVGVWTRQADRSVARARAQAVAGEIIRLGVAATRVDIRDALATAGGASVERSVEIFVDY